MDGSRIDDLRRRVDKDPASIAFAQLAEEYRREGELEEAVRVSREGLARHPAYVSARVTLARALVELGQHDEAQVELEGVLRSAPDNLSAIRALAEIHRSGEHPRTVIASPSAAHDLRTPAPEVQEPRRDTARGTMSPTRHATPTQRVDRVLSELEHWLEAIVADRAARDRRSATMGLPDA